MASPRKPAPRSSVRDYRGAQGQGGGPENALAGRPGPFPPVAIVVPGRPLSLNRTYRVFSFGGKARMSLTAEAKDYKARVAQYAAIAMQGRPMLTGDLRFRITSYWPRRAGDSDAATKPTKDALQGIVYANDRIVVQDVSTRDYDPDCPRVVITVEPMAPVVERVMDAEAVRALFVDEME